MKIDFKNYEKENNPFFKKTLLNIAKVLKLKSEYEHEKYIQAFEQEFADYNKSKYAIAVNSGTTSLQLALKASDVESNDEVILPSYTYIATALAVSNIEAKPIFIDIKEDTLTINPKEIEKNITKKTKAIISVHIHGNPCDMDKITKIAKKYNLAIIEDASHAHGAKYKGIKVGNFGIGCFSNHTTKILSGIGNSGLITTNDLKIYKTIKKMVKVKNEPDLSLSERTPCEINILQAAILRAKLPFINTMITKRRANALLYLKSLPQHIKHQREEKNSKHVYRDFVLFPPKRNKFIEYLSKNSIEAKVRYMIPLHLVNYYKKLGYKKGDLPITNDIFSKAVWCPISHVHSKKEIQHICKTIKNC